MPQKSGTDRLKKFASEPQSVTVLIIDHDEKTANAIRRVLDRSGYATILTGSVKDASTLLREVEDPPAVIDCAILALSEWINPEQADTLQREFPWLPVLIHTGYRDQAIQAIQFGA